MGIFSLKAMKRKMSTNTKPKTNVFHHGCEYIPAPMCLCASVCVCVKEREIGGDGGKRKLLSSLVVERELLQTYTIIIGRRENRVIITRRREKTINKNK